GGLPLRDMLLLDLGDEEYDERGRRHDRDRRRSNRGKGATPPATRQTGQVRTRPFFFQAADGIRDGHVTGVQTCALPICRPLRAATSSSPGTPRDATARRGRPGAPRPTAVEPTVHIGHVEIVVMPPAPPARSTPTPSRPSSLARDRKSVV